MTSEPTLYQWANTDSEAWDDLPALHDTLVADGVLVPVEPDDYLTITDDNWRTQYLDHSNELEPGRYAVIRIVDAGARIGGDDE